MYYVLNVASLRVFVTSIVLHVLLQLMGIAVGDAAVPLEKATHSESLDFSLLHAPTRTLQQLFERTVSDLQFPSRHDRSCRILTFIELFQLNERDYSRAKSLAESYDTIDVDLVLKREWRDICQNQTVTVENVDNILVSS